MKKCPCTKSRSRLFMLELERTAFSSLPKTRKYLINFIFKIELYSFLNVLIIGMFCGVDRIYAETWPVQTRPTGTRPANKFYFNACMILWFWIQMHMEIRSENPWWASRTADCILCYIIFLKFNQLHAGFIRRFLFLGEGLKKGKPFTRPC